MKKVFHISPRTGRPAPCRAQVQCPLGGENPHFETMAEAYQHIEREASKENEKFHTLRKKNPREEALREKERLNKEWRKTSYERDLKKVAEEEGIPYTPAVQEAVAPLLSAPVQPSDIAATYLPVLKKVLPHEDALTLAHGLQEAREGRLAVAHEQVVASRGFAVDAGAAPLVEELWRRGIETEFSCEGGDMFETHGIYGPAYVTLKDMSPQEAEELFAIPGGRVDYDHFYLAPGGGAALIDSPQLTGDRSRILITTDNYREEKVVGVFMHPEALPGVVERLKAKPERPS